MSVPISSVLFSVPQALTDAQKLQARQNAGAATAKKTTTSVPPVSTAIDTIQFFADGVIRGDSTDLGCMAPIPSQADSGKILKAMWTGSPGKGFAVWDTAPESTPWGINSNTTVTINNQPSIEGADPYTDPIVVVSGIQNYKNNIVNVVMPVEPDYYFCGTDILQITPPAISQAIDAYGFNFWVRLAISRARSGTVGKTALQVVIPYVGWELDQYYLSETVESHTFSAKRLKIADNPNSGYAQSYPKILEVQTVGPNATPTASDFNKFAPKIDVVVDYSEKYTANTSEATFSNSLQTATYELKNDFASTNMVTVDVPSYGYTNFYMIHVTGDMAKLKKFVPYLTNP